MDALKNLKLGEKYVLDQTYGPMMPQKQKLDELVEWACAYMNQTEGRPQLQFQYDRQSKRYVVERIR